MKRWELLHDQNHSSKAQALWLSLVKQVPVDVVLQKFVPTLVPKMIFYQLITRNKLVSLEKYKCTTHCANNTISSIWNPSLHDG